MKNLRIAIASTNRNKYSETFIQNHITHLPNVACVLSDGYLPTSYSLNRGKTFYSILPNAIDKFIVKLKGEQISPYLLSKVLKKERVQVMLAEYGPSGVEMMPICKQLNIPLIVHFHGYDAYRNDVLNSYGKQYKNLFQYAKATIAVSKDMEQQLKKLDCPENKIHYLPYGIDTTLFSPKNSSTEKLIVSCGRFVKKKSPDLILKTFQEIHNRFPESKLIMIGDGELLPECKLLANTLKIDDCVVFKGAVEQKEVIETLQQASLFLQHSVVTEENDSEGTPVSILEAMACGITVIATRHAGINDIITDGKTGFLVDEGDWKSMSVRAIELFDDESIIQQFGKNAREYVLNNHKLKNYISRLFELLTQSL